jgi:RNA polymerase sigma factor (TIGR02999 family)
VDVDDITELLVQARTGESQQLVAVFEALYPKLRSLAASHLKSGEQTFTPTVLVHELYLRMLSSQNLSIRDRKHFFATAAQAMRWVLVDHARRKSAGKRGGGQPLFQLGEDLLDSAADMTALHLGLDALDRLNPQRREIVELRYFAGLEFSEIAELLECSERTVYREWQRAKAFLYAQMSET